VKYRVHRLEVRKDTAQEKLEQFLNQMEGEVLAVVPYVIPSFQLMGATSKVDFLLIVEKVK
jgi:rhamnose utilization protein RhaD (predicted bifunctional aldolase and dehydrogenase)